MTKKTKTLIGVAAFLAVSWVWLGRVGGKNDSALDTALVEANLLVGGAVSDMQLSASGLDAIARREGFSATKYPDASGYSIGYGHFIKFGESFSEPISQAEARRLLAQDAEIAARAVRAYVTVPLSQSNFDALVSFVYNVGANAFKNSTLLKKLNAGDYAGAAAQLPRWNQSQGQVLDALVARREQEYQQFFA